MTQHDRTLRRFEFEYRIFFSLGIVAAVCGACLLWQRDAPNLLQRAGAAAGLSPKAALRAGYLCMAALMAAATLLRMWAGSALTARRVMQFRVRTDALMTEGPYSLVRNPIYSADFLAICGFALCLPPLGLLLPPLFLLHYLRLIGYEEVALRASFGIAFDRYRSAVPALLPRPRVVVRALPTALRTFVITPDGIRHNALYLLFVPGFLVAAWTESFLAAVLIGLPAVLDWAVVHTRIGVKPSAQGATAPVADTSLGRGSAESASDPAPHARRPRKTRVFEEVLYASCWEDPDMDRAAFALRPGDTVLTVTSGGDNALAFLLDDPAEVIAVDFNAAQNHMLELKRAALVSLPYEDLLVFAGVTHGRGRGEMYREVRGGLSPVARAYWDARPRAIARGLIHAGRYERYMRLLGGTLRLLIGRAVIEDLWNAPTGALRAELFRTRWDSRRWRLFTRLLLSRRTMSLLFDPAFFRYLEEDFRFGDHFASVVERAFCRLDPRESWFLSYALFGAYRGALPHWLRPENHAVLRARAVRIRLVQGGCGDLLRSLPADSVSGFNFTNIFEWMPASEVEALLRETVRVARPGAVCTYRNLLVPRRRPDALAGVLQADEEKASALHAHDRSFIYRAYVVETVHKEESSCVTTSCPSMRAA